MFSETRVAIPGVADRLAQEVTAGKELHLISGRAATEEWYTLTLNQLIAAHYPIDQERIHLTPPGVSTIAYKAAVLEDFDIEEFSDDSGGTILCLALYRPNTRFNWIRYGLTDASRAIGAILNCLPNVNVIAASEWKRRPGQV